MLYLELAIVIFLILINGVLAMAELAIVSSRRARLQALVDREVVGARRALALANDPGKFLSTVQIGITLVGVLSGAFSGATLGLRLGQWLAAQGIPPGIAEPAGVGRGGGADHLCLADRRRAGAQADRACAIPRRSPSGWRRP